MTRCLKCHREYEPQGGRSDSCPHCEFSNLRSAHQAYWSLSPVILQRMNRMRWAGAIWMVLAIPLAALASMTPFVMVFSNIFLLLVGPPAFWFTATRFNRRQSWPYLTVLWMAFFFHAAYFTWIQTHGRGNLALDGLLDGLSLLYLAAALFVPVAMKKFDAWKESVRTRPVSLDVVREGRVERSPKQVVNANYCLQCFTTMEHSSGHCDACGFNNLASDRRIYWNKNPKIQAWENFGKFMSTALGILIGIFAIFSMQHMGTGSGWFIAMPIVFVYVMWLTFAKMSRHLANTRPSTVWSAFFILLLVTMYPMIFFEDHGWFGVVCAIVVLLAGAAVPQLISMTFERWKTSLQSRAGNILSQS